MIAECPNCKPHPFQDSKYGFKKRVFNVADSNKNGRKARCTVCGSEKTFDAVKSTKKPDETADAKKAAKKAAKAGK